MNNPEHSLPHSSLFSPSLSLNSVFFPFSLIVFFVETFQARQITQLYIDNVTSLCSSRVIFVNLTFFYFLFFLFIFFSCFPLFNVFYLFSFGLLSFTFSVLCCIYLLTEEEKKSEGKCWNTSCHHVIGYTLV